MIQNKGKIGPLTPEQSEMVQKRLFALNYRWLGNYKIIQHTDAPWLIWSKVGYITFRSGQTEFDGDSRPAHTLRDFSLDEDSNELPPAPTEPSQPETKPAHTYKFGDKVKCGAIATPRYVFAQSNGLVAVMLEGQMKEIENGLYPPMQSCRATTITPWVEEFELAPGRMAIVDKDSITFEGITLTKEQLERALGKIGR